MLQFDVKANSGCNLTLKCAMLQFDVKVNSGSNLTLKCAMLQFDVKVCNGLDYSPIGRSSVPFTCKTAGAGVQCKHALFVQGTKLHLPGNEKGKLTLMFTAGKINIHFYFLTFGNFIKTDNNNK